MGKGFFNQESETKSSDGFQGTQNHIFDDSDAAEYWANVYEKAQYEGRHRFDPSFTWTPEEEKKLVRKLPELGMNTNDFNYGQTIFLVTFLAAELPSGLISKKVGPDRWIPFIIVCWSAISAAQVALSNRAGYFACRALLGLLMGGFIPDIVLWLSYFYVSIQLALILYCFLIEGLITAIIGVLSWGLMPPGPCQTKSWFRGKDGWFNEREELILVNRLLRDDPSKGDMNNRQAVGPVALIKCLKDFDLWPLYLLGLLIYIPPQPHANYLSYILRRLGFSTFHANLLAIPSQFMFAVNLLIITRISDKLNERAIVASTSNIWILPCLIALVALPESASTWTRYAISTVLLSYPYCHAILVGWNARISNTVRTRAVGAALYNMCVQAGNIIGSNIFREDDSPLYRRGNKILLAICSFNVVLFYAVKAYYVWRNKTRERKWESMSEEERSDYLLTTTDEGVKRLDFRFVH
ncbi:major facilitator superfamily domain-containing protein [Aspergillus sergii]|uniref:Major facilitator superfamily domain-containing protein n=1 Tax=Aspergillus sergii TaxID=1034303 RepID=A0A5N6X5D7_9EURO|nr:major facilitator superfamily domain-containing protein [Aspergillus sergii]